MATCFCGCGQRVSILSRGLNKKGAGTAGLVDRLRAVRPLAVQAGDGAPAVEDIDGLIKQGEGYVEFWEGAVHTKYMPADRKFIDEFKVEWNAWGETGTATVAEFEARG